MQLFSYVVARDFGFAPNPFFGFCTLATCKPQIRRMAKLGDWVTGTGSAMASRTGTLVFAMRVEEILTFDDYWRDPRFEQKRPRLSGSLKQAFGDNIYHRDRQGNWLQLDSHHTLPDGSPNESNIRNDTSATERVLVSTDFVYFGGEGPLIPDDIRFIDGQDLCAGRGHKSNFTQAMVKGFDGWVRSLGTPGYQGKPLDWHRALGSQVRR